MLLKCKYLAQFSVNELAKNTVNFSKAEAKCPFLSFARSSIHTGLVQTTDTNKENESLSNL